MRTFKGEDLKGKLSVSVFKYYPTHTNLT